MHSKRRYEFCIRTVIPGELKSFRNYSGFSFIFQKIYVKYNLTYFESENFSDSFFHRILNPKIVGFLFFQAWGGECEKFSFRKSYEIDKISRALCMKKTVIVN